MYKVLKQNNKKIYLDTGIKDISLTLWREGQSIRSFYLTADIEKDRQCSGIADIHPSELAQGNDIIETLAPKMSRLISIQSYFGIDDDIKEIIKKELPQRINEILERNRKLIEELYNGAVSK